MQTEIDPIEKGSGTAHMAHEGRIDSSRRIRNLGIRDAQEDHVGGGYLPANERALDLEPGLTEGARERVAYSARADECKAATVEVRGAGHSLGPLPQRRVAASGQRLPSGRGIQASE